MSLADIHDKQETATMKAQTSPSSAIKAATRTAGKATATAQKSVVSSGAKVASGSKAAPQSSLSSSEFTNAFSKSKGPGSSGSSPPPSSGNSGGTKTTAAKSSNFDSVGSGGNFNKLQSALATVKSNPSAAVRAGKADAVDLNPGKLNFSQLQDLLDTGTPAAARPKANGFALSDNPGSDFGSWEDFVKNVQNRSLGSPRAEGYGTNPGEIIGFDPMAQDTAAMRRSTATGGIADMNRSGSPDDRGRGIDALATIHDFLQAPYNKRVEENGGKAPFEGVVDWSGIHDFLQAPYNKRVEANGGKAPFEGAVDWGGIVAALTGNAHKNEAARRGTATPLSTTGAFDSVDTAGPNWGNLLDLTSGALDNTDVPDRLAANVLPATTPLTAPDAPIAFTGDDKQQQIDGYNPALGGIDAATVAPPRRDPRGYASNDVFSTDGQVSTPDGTVITPGSSLQPGYNGGVTGPMKPEEPSTWDKVVDNGGKLLSHTGLGTIVSTLFPGIWNAGGDMMKGLDNGGGSGGGIDNVAFTNLINGGSDPFFTHKDSGSGRSGGGKKTPTTPTTPATEFPDVNHNGIDDRLETGAYGPNSLPTLANRYAVFPDMPPYNPGVDDEWTYFRNHLARGGVVGYADGGEVSPLAEADPRVMMIADAEDALHNAVNGTPEPDDGPAIQKFVKAFGQDALEQLKQNVTGGLKMRPPGVKKGRMVTGPGGPKDDAIPAVIDGTHPAALSSGEFVMPAEAVAGAGDGDPAAGAQRLQELSQQFAQKAA